MVHYGVLRWILHFYWLVSFFKYYLLFKTRIKCLYVLQRPKWRNLHFLFLWILYFIYYFFFNIKCISWIICSSKWNWFGPIQRILEPYEVVKLLLDHHILLSKIAFRFLFQIRFMLFYLLYIIVKKCESTLELYRYLFFQF